MTAVFAVGGSVQAQAAQDFYWNAATGKWETVANWSTGSQSGPVATVLPDNTDSVRINNNGTATIGTDEIGNANNFQIGGSNGKSGFLNLAGGGKATAVNNIILGIQFSSSGTVTVNGIGSELNGNYLYVGVGGTGMLNLTAGGKATSASNIWIGTYLSSRGTVTVDGGGSELNGHYLYVGSGGTGVLNLTNGGRAASASNIMLGYETGSSGTVNVGAGSTLTSMGAVYVGNVGKGLLAGTGTVEASTRVNRNGTISPGDGPNQIGTLTIDDNLTLQNNATLQIDYNASDIDLVNVTGSATISGNLNISISSLTGGTIASHRTIVHADGGMTVNPGPLTSTLQLNGLGLTGSRILGSRVETLVVADTDLVINDLTLINTGNKNVTWGGGTSGNWDIATLNWTDDDASDAATTFLDGDAVTFGTMANTTVNILGTQKTVSGMTVINLNDTDNLTISGNIVADANSTSTSGVNNTGKLDKFGGGSLTLNGANEFKNGVTLSGGTIILGNDKALGTYVTNTTTTTEDSQGQLIVLGNSTVAVTKNRNISNRFSAELGKLTFDIAAGKTLTIDGVINAASDTDDRRFGGAIGTLETGHSLAFTGTGSLVIRNSGTINGHGGTIYTRESVNLSSFASATFTSNSAGSNGGAISANRDVTLGNNATFTSNSAGESGGAIEADNIMLGTNTLFKDNHAHDGGAINVGENTTISGNTYFTNNLAAANGGAIYMYGFNSTNTATLDADTGDIAFTGNKSGVNFTDPDNPDGGTANSIYLRRSTTLQLRGGHNIYFDDPIGGSNQAGHGLVLNTEFTGFVQFAGDSTLQNNFRVTIFNGTMRLAHDAANPTQFGGTGVTGPFSLTLDGTLAGSGTLDFGSFNIGGTLSPDSAKFTHGTFDETTNSFRNDAVTTIAASQRIGTLTLRGNTTFNNASTLKIDIDPTATQSADLIDVIGNVNFSSPGTQTIDLGSWVNGTYTIVKASDTMGNLDGTPTFKFNGGTYDMTRLTPSANVVGKELRLTLATQQSVNNQNLTWTGLTDDTWTVGERVNWENAVPEATVFQTGDAVTFDSATAGGVSPWSITVADGGVTASSMTVTGSGDWTFTGNITTDADSSTTLDVHNTGKLHLNGTGTVTLNGENQFKSGVEMTGGTVVLGHNQALGIWTAGGDVAANGGVLATTNASTIKVTEDRTIQNHIQLGTTTNRTGELTFDIATGKTLTIGGVENTAAPNTYVNNGGAINVNVPGPASPLQFTGGGSLVLSDNISGYYGGAVGAYFGNQSSALDFNGLSSITFLRNIAGNNGDGEGGGIYSASYNSYSSVNLGDHATFTRNIAGNLGDGEGGGIYSASFSANSSSVILGDYATFTGNIAGNRGFGYGGGIRSDGNASSTTAFGSHAFLTENRAGGNNAGGQGGAINQSAGTLTLRGDTFLSGNLVSKGGGGGGSYGGAIYMAGAYDSTLVLDTSLTGGSGYAPIAFSGNKTGVDTTGGVIGTTGTANSIHLEKNTQLNLRGDGNVYFDDPISSGTVGNNSLVKNGNGFVQFVGNNRLNTTGFAGTNSVDVQAGTLRIVNNGATESFDATGAKTFNVATAATLAGQGTVKSTGGFTISGALSPDSDRFEIPTWTGDLPDGTRVNSFGTERTTLAAGKEIGTLTLDGNTALDGATLAVDIASAGSYDQIAVTGTVGIAGANTVDVNLTSWMTGTYDLITSTGTMTNSGTFAVNVHGITDDAHYRTAVDVDDASKILQLKLDIENQTLTWTGATDGAWDVMTTENWTNNPGGVATTKRFADGDTVTFNSAYATPGTVTVAVGGVSQNGMTVTGSGNWTFTGGAIGGTGGLTKNGSSSLTLSNVNTFTGATSVNGGSLILANAAALAQSGVSIYFGGTLESTGDTTVKALGSYSGSIVDPTGVMTVTNTASFVGSTLNLQAGTDRIAAIGNVAFAATNSTINVTHSGAMADATYDLVTGATVTYGGLTLDLTHDYGPLTDRQSVRLLQNATALRLETAVGLNRNLTWNSAAGNWSGANWSGVTDGTFLDNDGVTFDSGTNTVNVDGNYTVANMNVAGGNHTFTGTGSIASATTVKNLDGSLVTPVNLTKKLTVSGGSATFGVVTNFENGIDVTGGSLILTDGGSFSDRNIANAGTVTFDRNVADYSYGGTISGNGNIVKTGSKTVTFLNDADASNLDIAQGTLSVASGKTITVSNEAKIAGILSVSTGMSALVAKTIAFDSSGNGTVNLTSYDGVGTYVLATAIDANGITGNYKATVGGTPFPGPNYLDTYSNASIWLSADGRQLLAKQDLLWNATAHNSAHGIFDIAGSYEVNAGLAPNTRADAWYSEPGYSWDGNSLIKRGSGVLTLSEANSYTGATTVEDGTLRLNHANALNMSDVSVNGAEINTTGTTTIKSLTTTGNSVVAPTGIMTVSNNLSLNGTRLNMAANTDKIAVGGTVSFGATKNTVNLATFVEGDDIELITSAGMSGLAADYFNAVTVGGGAIGSRQSAVLRIENNILYLDTVTGENLDLQWLGGDNGHWTTTGAWNIYGSSPTVTDTFNPNDSVVFDAAGVATNNVVVDGGATVSGMKVDSGNYIFSGGAITGTMTAKGDKAAKTGKLQIAAGATATFQNEIAFANGIDNAGTLRFNPASSFVLTTAIDGAGTTWMDGGELIVVGVNTSTGTFTQTGGTLHLNSDWHGNFVQTGGEGGGSLNTDDGRQLLQSAEFRSAVDPAGTLFVAQNLKLDGATITFNPTVDMIDVGGAVTFGTNANTVDLSTFMAGTDIVLISSTNMTGSASDHFGPVTLNGGQLGNRQNVTLRIDGNQLLMTAIMGASNSLVWIAGANGDWTTTGDWKIAGSNPPETTTFNQGDFVTFDDSGTDKTVNITGPVTVSGMRVEGGQYVFGGSTITGVKSAVGSLVAPTGKLEISGAGTTAEFSNGIAFAEGINVGTGAGLILAQAGPLVLDQPVSGGGSITKTGSGQLTFSGNNAGYTGTTGIAGGILRAENPGALGSGTVTVDTDGTLALAFDGTFANEISGTGALTTAGDITLDRANPNYSGTATNQSGTLTVADTRALGAVGNFVNAAGATANLPSGFAGNIANSGIVRLGTVYGSGAHLADVAQRGANAWGNVTNGGVLYLLKTQTRFGWGGFVNNGHLDFVNAGNELYVDSLAGAGTIRMDVDALNADDSDQLIIRQTVAAGTQQALQLTDVTTNPNQVTQDTTFAVASMADGAVLPDGTVTGTVDIGLYTFNVGTSGSAGVAVVTGLSVNGQAVLNTIGAMSTGWFQQLDNLNKRMGELRLDNSSPPPPPSSSSSSGDYWFRSYGGQTNADLGIAGVSGFREYQYGADVGVDWRGSLDADNTLVVGLFTGYQRADRTFRDGRGSKGDTDDIYGGVYVTWLHAAGWYADLVAKGQSFSSDYTARSAGGTDNGDFDTWGAGLSLEAGRQFALKGNWFVEPSLQASWLHVSGKDYTTDSSLRVSTTDADIYQFTAQVRAGKTFVLGKAQVLQPYVKLGIIEQISDGGSVKIVDEKWRPNTDGQRGIAGVGVIWQLSAVDQIHVDYEANWGDKFDRPWSVNLGYRRRW